MPIKFVNRETGSVIFEEADNGELTIHDKQFKESYEKAMAQKEASQQKINNPMHGVSTGYKKTEEELIKSAHEKLHKAWEGTKNKSLVTPHAQVLAKMKELGIEHSDLDELDKLEG